MRPRGLRPLVVFHAEGRQVRIFVFRASQPSPNLQARVASLVLTSDAAEPGENMSTQPQMRATNEWSVRSARARPLPRKPTEVVVDDDRSICRICVG